MASDLKHADRHEILSSLPARIAYLQEFLDFGREDIEALASSRKVIKSILPSIVDKVYAKLLKHDITARVFVTRDSRSTEDPEEWPTLGGSTIQRRKIFLRWYLTKLNSDPTTTEYWEYLDKVGAMHVSKARRLPLHVDYIFLGASLGLIQNSLTESIFSLQDREVSFPQRLAMVKAIGKVIWIQNDLLAKWHLRDDQQENSTDEDKAPAPDLHAKMCPFTGASDTVVETDSNYDLLPVDSGTESYDALKDYKLLRLSQLEGRTPIEVVELANVEHLHDGSLELLVLSSDVSALRKALDAQPNAMLDLNYDPWRPTPEAEVYFGQTTASKLCREWTLTRAQRLKSQPSRAHVREYYTQLLEQNSGAQSYSSGDDGEERCSN